MNRICKGSVSRVVCTAVSVLFLTAVFPVMTGCGRQIVVRSSGSVTGQPEEEQAGDSKERNGSVRPDVSAREDRTETEAQTDHDTAETCKVMPEEALIYVHVSGMVHAPGVYELREGDRVYQAVEAAGGFLPEADRDWCNLAQVLSDADKLRIYSVAETTAMTEDGITPRSDSFGIVSEMTGSESAAAKAADGKESGIVNLNTAGVDELMTLPGIGPRRAEDIVAYRQMNGGFSSVEELVNISGIGKSMLSKLSGLVTV